MMPEYERYKDNFYYVDAKRYFQEKLTYTQLDDKEALETLELPESPAAQQLIISVKKARNEAYLKSLMELAEEPIVWFNPTTLKRCQQDEPSALSIDTASLLTTKFSDTINNLATLQGMKKIHARKRKVEEAKTYILPLAEKLSPKHARSLRYWIGFWEDIFEEGDKNVMN